MRKAQSLVLASLVFACSALATVGQISAAPLAATGTTLFMQSENPDDGSSVAPPEENVAPTLDEMDVTALVDETVEADWTPARRPAPSVSHPSDDNS